MSVESALALTDTAVFSHAVRITAAGDRQVSCRPCRLDAGLVSDCVVFTSPSNFCKLASVDRPSLNTHSEVTNESCLAVARLAHVA